MLTANQRRAVEMLFRMTEGEVVGELRISRRTLEEWKRLPEFCEALNARLRDNRRTSVLLISQRLVEAARELESMLRSKDEKIKQKAIVDILKASGLLKGTDPDDGDTLGGLLDRLDRASVEESEDDGCGEED